MHIDADGCRLSFSVTGPKRAPALLLLNALGTTTGLWDAQVTPLSRGLRVIRCDTRGHGGSDAPAGDCTLDRLGHDALAVLAGARGWSWTRPTWRTWSNPLRSTRRSSSS